MQGAMGACILSHSALVVATLLNALVATTLWKQILLAIISNGV